MAIQWFPGHMTTARKKAAETMALIDVVVEVLDARLPEAGSNPMIHELRAHRQRPCLKLLNKVDLADPEAKLGSAAWGGPGRRQSAENTQGEAQTQGQPLQPDRHSASLHLDSF
mgnify:CR=1 FL=1